MNISKEKFEEIVSGAIDGLPEKFKQKLHNVAILIEDAPSKEQLRKTGLRRDELLLGLFEGYIQSKRLNFGPVLPDRITIFSKALCRESSDEVDLKRRIESTVKHEIAHHFGSDEFGARKASRRNP